ncbi:QsdR family transcriptional regulator [Mycobacterium vicinigordonae]|uniref:TetR/AcrR family transcriptional regulator n=1 Tax=Mycobacterium vicinigordonae TaxID=1719132 RepID=A0A7D6E0Y3_9MYCO|nr:QsdR family transcriptional regulator [Mycobacterium vicinigordonae]QLL09547.1 TetR/AcrR family transcriptional regulator [Mycobacterium vicinigordonae]
MSETPLARLLAEERRPDALTAFRIARRRFIDGRRIEMGELATELGVNRATLFRWVGSRDELLAEILWSLAKPTLALAVQEAPGEGGQRIAAISGRFARLMDDAEFFRAFLRREPERALRILTTRAGTIQARVVEAVETLLDEEISRGRLNPPLPPHDLAYLIMRIIESFLYADLITGEQRDIDGAERAITALLR